MILSQGRNLKLLRQIQLDDITQAIIDTAITGEPGDGIILVSTVEQAINIYYLGRT